jgi:hypothetical protein
MRLDRALFQRESTRPLPEDAERLARLERIVARYTNDGSPKRQVNAARRLARAEREISCIRSFREEMMESINPAYLDHKTVTKLVALRRCESLAAATIKRAEHYLGFDV